VGVGGRLCWGLLRHELILLTQELPALVHELKHTYAAVFGIVCCGVVELMREALDVVQLQPLRLVEAQGQRLFRVPCGVPTQGARPRSKD
jgi:hypothetical protein